MKKTVVQEPLLLTKVGGMRGGAVLQKRIVKELISLVPYQTHVKCEMTRYF